MTPVNVAAFLTLRARESGDRVALQIPMRAVSPDRTTPHRAVTFQELNQLCDRLAWGLEESGIRRGVKTALMVPPSLPFFAITFALLKIGAVPVLIDPGMGVKNLGKCLDDAAPEAFVGIFKAHLARRLLGWGKRTVRITGNVGKRRWGCTFATAEFERRERNPYPEQSFARDDLAAILFTSGSTGIAKGVEYSHGIFTSQVEMIQAEYGIEPGEIDFCTFPLFALFGPALGMTCILPDMNPARPAQIDPRKVRAQVNQLRATNLFGSPAVVRRLGELPLEKKPLFPTLRRVLSAGAPASAAALEALTKRLPPGCPIHTPYGATESLPTATISSADILKETRSRTDNGEGVCVGRAFARMSVAVIAITEEPIPEWSDTLLLPTGTIGEFVVRGPVVTRRYHRRERETALAKIVDPATGETLHRMGDVGWQDEQGRLWFCGRKSHRVVLADRTLFTDQVEPVFNTHPGVRRSALVGVRQDGKTVPVICIERNPKFPWKALVVSLRELADSHAAVRGIVDFLEHPQFPVDVRHNSKIFREKLALWATERLTKEKR